MLDKNQNLLDTSYNITYIVMKKSKQHKPNYGMSKTEFKLLKKVKSEKLTVFTPKEIEIIDRFIDVTLKNKKLLATEKELNKKLKNKN